MAGSVVPPAACSNHADKPAAGNCFGCGKPFCPDCLIVLLKQNYCGSCKAAAVKGACAVWREGTLLVMSRSAQLPDRCVKTNGPAAVSFTKTYSWHSPWIYLAVFVSPILYVIIALIARKTAVVTIGLSARVAARRRLAILIGWLGTLGGIGISIIGGILDYPPVAVAGIPIAVGCLIYGLARAQVVSAAYIDDRVVKLKGICPEFLDGLTEAGGS